MNYVCQYKQKMKSVDRLKWIVVTIVLGVLEIAAGLIECVLWTSAKLYAIWTFVFYGLIGLGVRAILLWLCPPLDKSISTLASMINAIIEFLNDGFNSLYDGVNIIMWFINKDVVERINSIISVLKVFGVKKISGVNFSGLKWQNIEHVDASPIHEYFSSVPPTCTTLDSMPKIVLWFIRLFAAQETCSAVRYLYPLEKVYDAPVFSTALGWLYPGSAAPVLYTGANCEQTDAFSSPSAATVTCLCLGLPYLFLEFYLPILMIRIIVPPLSDGVSKLWQVGIFMTRKAVYYVYTVLFSFLQALLSV